MVIVTVHNMLQLNSRSFEITYNSEQITPLTVAGLFPGPILEQGEFGRVQILSLLPGKITFQFKESELSNGIGWSGVINTLQFQFTSSFSGSTMLEIRTI